LQLWNVEEDGDYRSPLIEARDFDGLPEHIQRSLRLIERQLEGANATAFENAIELASRIPMINSLTMQLLGAFVACAHLLVSFPLNQNLLEFYQFLPTLFCFVFLWWIGFDFRATDYPRLVMRILKVESEVFRHYFAIFQTAIPEIVSTVTTATNGSEATEVS
jgi:hypothetical protein